MPCHSQWHNHVPVAYLEVAEQPRLPGRDGSVLKVEPHGPAPLGLAVFAVISTQVQEQVRIAHLPRLLPWVLVQLGVKGKEGG